MRTIGIEDDVYRFILQKAIEIGESASSILRREFGLPNTQVAEPVAASPNGTSTSDAELLAIVTDPAFQRHGSVKDKYLEILSVVARKHGEDFERVFPIGGRNRRYFARTSDEIRNSGISTQPRSIPGTPYWALTNAATRHKRQILRRALATLGYSTTTIRETVGSVVR